jgi:glycosyltransferase involved in cell wall biosynthesis
MWGVNPRKISVIYNAFEGVQEPESKEALRDKLGLAGSVVLSAGRLVPWKGFSELIALVPTLREQIPNLRLLIIGEGPERSRLLAQIDQLGLKDVVVLMHRQPQTVLLNHVRAADLFVLNSSYEGFSHLLLEVMAIGTPLVATRVGGNPELIEDRESGLLVPVRDGEALTTAMVSVLNDTALSSKLVANGRSRVQSFSEERMISELEAVMKTLCAS